MEPTSTTNPNSPIPVPEVAGDGPAVVIPTASVAPLDGPPDGERINTFTLAPPDADRAAGGSTALANLRGGVRSKPLPYVCAAFALGFLVARVLR